MASLGVIADMHGNLVALRSVLEFLEGRGVGQVVCLGDFVGFGAAPNECVALIRDRGIPAVVGNHDLIGIGHLGFEGCANKAAFALRRTRRELSDESRMFLAALPRQRVLEDGVVMFHGGASGPEEYLTTPSRMRRTVRVLQREHPGARVCLFGHTHDACLVEVNGGELISHDVRAPAVLRAGSTYLINPGAVDGSRGSGEARAQCSVVDVAAGRVEFHEVEYDHESAERQARERGYRIGAWTRQLYRAAERGRRWSRRTRIWAFGPPGDSSRAESIPPSPVIDWVTRLSDIEALEPEWKILEETIGRRAVFSTWDYVLPWYRAYAGLEGEPFVGIVRSGGRVAGIAPFVIRRTTIGKVPVRRVDLAGYDGDGGEILLIEDRPELLDAILRSLARSGAADVACIDHLRRGTDLWEVLEDAAAQEDWRLETEPFWYATAELSAGYESYWRARSQNFRRQTKRHAEGLEAAGPVRLEGIRLGGDPALAPQALERMFAIVDASWKSRVRGRPMKQAHRVFYRELGARFAARGLLDVGILTIGGRDAAVSLTVAERGIGYSTLVGYDDAFQKLSPGTHLMQCVLRALAEAGIREFVSHGMYEYKRRWATACPTADRALVFFERPRAWLAHAVKYRVGPRLQHSGEAPASGRTDR